MTKPRMIACASGVAAVLLGAGGAVAAAHPLSGPATSAPAAAPADHPGQTGLVDRPEPRDQPNPPGATETPEPEDGPGDTNEGPGEETGRAARAGESADAAILG